MGRGTGGGDRGQEKGLSRMSSDTTDFSKFRFSDNVERFVEMYPPPFNPGRPAQGYGTSLHSQIIADTPLFPYGSPSSVGMTGRTSLRPALEQRGPPFELPSTSAAPSEAGPFASWMNVLQTSATSSGGLFGQPSAAISAFGSFDPSRWSTSSSKGFPTSASARRPSLSTVPTSFPSLPEAVPPTFGLGVPPPQDMSKPDNNDIVPAVDFGRSLTRFFEVPELVTEVIDLLLEEHQQDWFAFARCRDSLKSINKFFFTFIVTKPVYWTMFAMRLPARHTITSFDQVKDGKALRDIANRAIPPADVLAGRSSLLVVILIDSPYWLRPEHPDYTPTSSLVNFEGLTMSLRYVLEKAGDVKVIGKMRKPIAFEKRKAFLPPLPFAPRGSLVLNHIAFHQEQYLETAQFYPSGLSFLSRNVGLRRMCVMNSQNFAPATLASQTWQNESLEVLHFCEPTAEPSADIGVALSSVVFRSLNELRIAAPCPSMHIRIPPGSATRLRSLIIGPRWNDHIYWLVAQLGSIERLAFNGLITVSDDHFYCRNISYDLTKFAGDLSLGPKLISIEFAYCVADIDDAVSFAQAFGQRSTGSRSNKTLILQNLKFHGETPPSHLSFHRYLAEKNPKAVDLSFGDTNNDILQRMAEHNSKSRRRGGGVPPEAVKQTFLVGGVDMKLFDNGP